MTATRQPMPAPTLADVERLVRFDAGGARILSVYLDLEPERRATRSYRIVFGDLWKAVREDLDKRTRRALEAEVGRIQEWLEVEQQPRGRGVAFFSSSDAGLRSVHLLSVPVPDRVAFERHPLVTPLLALVEDLEPAVVALVDKASARLITVSEGRIESVEAFTDDVPGKHDQGGPAQARLQRHHEDHVRRHVQRVVERLSELVRERRFERLLLAGPEEAMTEVRTRLPPELARRVIATLRAEMSAPDDEILRLTLEVERRAEREREEAQVSAVIDASKSEGPGACGWSATLEAVWLRQVLTLVLADGLTASGSECRVDGRLYPEAPGPCPLCGAETLPVGDLADRAAQLTLVQDAEVEIAHDAAAGRLRDSCDGMGAVLRFRLHA